MLPRTVHLVEQAGATRIMYAQLEGRYQQITRLPFGQNILRLTSYRSTVSKATVELLT